MSTNVFFLIVLVLAGLALVVLFARFKLSSIIRLGEELRALEESDESYQYLRTARKLYSELIDKGLAGKAAEEKIQLIRKQLRNARRESRTTSLSA